MVGDVEASSRTWQRVMDEILKLKDGETLCRWKNAVSDKALDRLRTLPILETRAEHFLRAMEQGKVSTNIYLRRIHNFAIGMNWLPCPIIPTRMWPEFHFKEKRAITLKEHLAVIAREKNPERRAFYVLAWHLGASQSDIAFLDAENIDWDNQIISYARKKTGELAFVRFGAEVESVLRDLPECGPLFPYLRTVRPCDRATEFKQRCPGLGIEGVSARAEAIFILSAMIGAVTIARIADDPKLSALILEQTKKHLMALHPNIGKKKNEETKKARSAP